MEISKKDYLASKFIMEMIEEGLTPPESLELLKYMREELKRKMEEKKLR